MSASIRSWPPEKSHLLDGHFTEHWEIGVTHDVIVVIDSESYADIERRISRYTAIAFWFAEFA